LSLPIIVTDEKGETRKKYHLRDMMTPSEKLKSRRNAGTFIATQSP